MKNNTYLLPLILAGLGPALLTPEAQIKQLPRRPTRATELARSPVLDAFGAKANYAVRNVVDQFMKLRHHGEALGFHRGTGGKPDCKKNHYQGIARSNGHGTPYLFISRKAGNLGEAEILVVKMASRRADGERLRSNRLRKGLYTRDSAPPTIDRGIHSIRFSGSFPAYKHPGGIQVFGDMLAVALEEPVSGRDLPGGAIALIDVASPESPSFVDLLRVGLTESAYVAMAIDRATGKYLILAGGVANYRGLKVIEYSRSDHHTTILGEWNHDQLRNRPAGYDSDTLGWNKSGGGYQNMNLVEQQDGKLYLIGTRKTGVSDAGGCGCLGSCGDYADLYRVDLVNGKLELTFITTKHMWCHRDETGNTGNFDAGSGVYVSPTGELLLYAVEHKDSGPNQTICIGEYRHHDVKGNSTGACEPWIELYEHDNGWRADSGSRSIILDGPDYSLEDWQNLSAHDEFDNRTSSVRWCAPVGFRLILYEHPNFRGRAISLKGTGKVRFIGTLTMAPYSFNDTVSSVRDQRNP